MHEHTFKIKSLEVSSGSKLLSSASFSIEKGEILAVYGPGGSGKSLMLNYLNGIVSKDLSYRSEKFAIIKGKKYFLDLNNRSKSGNKGLPPEGYQIYLIDEPENGIDLQDFNSLCAQITACGGSMVFVTHHLDYLGKDVDYVLVMRYGIHIGTYTRENFFNSEDPYIHHISIMGC